MFLNPCLYDCFRVYGAKRVVDMKLAAALLKERQIGCSRIARSGKAAYPKVVVKIERVKVVIEYTTSGITMAIIM
jgi:hypothetical protein